MDTEIDNSSDNRNNADILLDSVHSKSETVNKKSNISTFCISCDKPKHPCDPEPTCPTTPCDPFNIKLQCSTGNVCFKLSCTKIPPDCDHPEARYECELIDKDVDPKVMKACNLKCERIQAFHSGQPIVIEEDIQNSQIPMVIEEVDNKKKKEDKPSKRVATMLCSKDGVSFKMKCTTTAPDPKMPNEIRFICEIDGEEGSEQGVTTDKILDTLIRCKQIRNVMDSVLGDPDDKDIENINNSATTDISNDECKEQEDNPDDLIISDDEDERPINQCKEKKKSKLFVCSYVESEEPLNPFNESEINETTPPLSPLAPEISAMQDDNTKLIFACRSKPKTEKGENQYTNNSNESIKLDCNEEDEQESCEKPRLVGGSGKDQKYKCNKLIESPENDKNPGKPCDEQSLIDYLTSSFICHHNETVKIIKVAANDLLCLITDSKEPCNNNSNCVNAVIEYTKDTFDALAAHTSKLIGSNKECTDNEPKNSECKICPKPREIFFEKSPKDLIESAKDIINNIANNDIRKTNKHLRDNPTQSLTGVTTLLSDDVKSMVTEDTSVKASPPRVMSYNFDSDESIPETNIFQMLKDKIRAIFYDESDTENTVSASSSSSSFSKDSDDDNVQNPLIK